MSYLKKLVLKLREGKDNLPKLDDDVLSVCIESCFLSSQRRSPFLEKYIKHKFRIKEPKDHISGDGISRRGYNIEIKVSLGNGGYNFVQIRPDHNIDFYLFLCYDYTKEELGKVTWLLISSKEMINLILYTKQYAHGTIAKLGQITRKNIRGYNHEYAIRVTNSPKGKDIWKKLIKYEIKEEDINNYI